MTTCQATYHVNKGHLREEMHTTGVGDLGFLTLGYHAVMPYRGVFTHSRSVSVDKGSSLITGTTMTVLDEDEASTYTYIMKKARQVAAWNRSCPTPDKVQSQEEAVECLRRLVVWATSGTSEYDLSHHGITMEKYTILNGYPIRMVWGPSFKHGYSVRSYPQCIPREIGSCWAMPSPGEANRAIVEAAGLTAGHTWNNECSIVVNTEVHSSVAAAFTGENSKPDVGRPLLHAEILPVGWM